MTGSDHPYEFPLWLSLLLLLVGFLLVNYGWHLLLAVILAAVVWTNIKPSIMRWLRKREERLDEANFDPVKAEHYQEGMMRAREKMQKELEEKAKEYQEIAEEVWLYAYKIVPKVHSRSPGT